MRARSASAAASRCRIFATTGSGALAMNAGLPSLARPAPPPSRRRPGPCRAGLRSAATSIVPERSSSTVTPTPTGSDRRRGEAPRPARRGAAASGWPLVRGERGAVEPVSRAGDPLAGLEALVGAEPADLGDQPLQRGDLAPRRRRRARRRLGGRPSARRPDSPPVSVGPQLLGDERRRSGAAAAAATSSTCAEHAPGRLAAARPRRAAPWPARGTSRRPRPRRSGTARRRPWRTRSPRRARRPRRSTSLQPGQDPAVGGGQLRRPAGHRSTRRAVDQREPGGVPQLVAEVAGALRPTPRRSARRRRGWRRAARVKRSASAPYASIQSSGSTTLPQDFDIFLPNWSRTRPCSATVSERLPRRPSRTGRTSSSGRPRRTGCRSR